MISWSNESLTDRYNYRWAPRQVKPAAEHRAASDSHANNISVILLLNLHLPHCLQGLAVAARLTKTSFVHVWRPHITSSADIKYINMS